MRKLLIPLLLTLASCSTLGVPSASTFNEKWAAAVQADTAVVQTTTTLLAADKIKADDAKNVEAQADNVKAALDIARTTYATDQTGGTTKLQSALTALTALQTYLETKK
jgi:hypothetical protein